MQYLELGENREHPDFVCSPRGGAFGLFGLEHCLGEFNYYLKFEHRFLI